MNTERMYQVILGAHISEKTSAIAESANQFAFKVMRDATAQEIKEAVETIYKVNVTGVKVMNVKGKVKRNWRGISRSPSWKKAYVRLAEGQDIDFS